MEEEDSDSIDDDEILNNLCLLGSRLVFKTYYIFHIKLVNDLIYSEKLKSRNISVLIAKFRGWSNSNVVHTIELHILL